MRKEIEKLMFEVKIFGNDWNYCIDHEVSDELWALLEKERHEDEDLDYYKDLLAVLRRL